MVRTNNGESVLSRALRIFEAFTPDDPTLRVSDIAARTGLHLATASRMVAELVGLGLLAREPDRRIRIGVRLWELALGFGFGIHQCVGQHVARLEAECLLTALAERVQRIDLNGATKRHHNNTLRAWKSLPLRVA